MCHITTNKHPHVSHFKKGNFLIQDIGYTIPKAWRVEVSSPLSLYILHIERVFLQCKTFPTSVPGGSALSYLLIYYTVEEFSFKVRLFMLLSRVGEFSSNARLFQLSSRGRSALSSFIIYYTFKDFSFFQCVIFSCINFSQSKGRSFKGK